MFKQNIFRGSLCFGDLVARYFENLLSTEIATKTLIH